MNARNQPMRKILSWTLFSSWIVAAQAVTTTSRLQVHIPKSLSKENGYDHRDALFGIPPYGASIQQQVYYADQNLCDQNVDNTKGYPERPKKNGKMEPWVSPFILMVDRGDCTFVRKVRNAQRAGAAAVLIADTSCVCAFEDCSPEMTGAPCEVQEPIMADDGSGSDISIPSFLVFKQDADPIREALKKNTQVRVEMTFSMPSPDARVEYDLWTVPTDITSQPIEKSFKEAAVALGDKALFTPHMFIYNGLRAGCDQDGVNECFNLCTNNGRYCAIDPDDDLDSGISGADVVTESLRRLCIWKNYGSDGIGKEYWLYVDEFLFRCGNPNKPELFTDETCITDAMDHAGVNKIDIDSCITDSGGLDDDVTNTILEDELSAKDAAGVVIIPTFFVNQAPVRGQLSFATAFKAICAGYAKGSEPEVCAECANCVDEAGCVKEGSCSQYQQGLSAVGGAPAVSVPVFLGAMIGITLVFTLAAYVMHQRQQRHMQAEVRGILAQYMPVDGTRPNVDTSVGIEETEGEFTIS